MARRIMYSLIEDGGQMPREWSFLVVTVKSLSRWDMGEEHIDRGWKRMTPWAYVAFWWDLG